MDVRCERCKTEYELDDARITEAGVAVRCTSCGHVFKVKKKALVVTVPMKPEEFHSQDVASLSNGPLPPRAPPEAPMPPQPPRVSEPVAPRVPTPAPAPAQPPRLPEPVPPPQPPRSAEPLSPVLDPDLPPPSSGGGAREWKVRQANGNVFSFKELTTLQKWIVERKVARDDEISLTGEKWKRLGNIAELASFFQVVEEAQRALQLTPSSPQVPVVASPSGPHPIFTPTEPTPQVLEPARRPAVAPPVGDEPAFARTVSGGAVRNAALPTKPSGGGSARWFVLALLIVGAGAAAGLAVLRPEMLELVLSRIDPSRAGGGGVTIEPNGTGGDPGTPAVAAKTLPDAGSEDAGLAALTPESAATAVAPPVDAGTELHALPDAGDDSSAIAAVAPDAGMKSASGEARPPSYDGLLSQGYKFLERERPAQALDAFGKAAELKPDRAEPHSGQGRAYFDLGRLDAAESAFLAAIKLNSRYGEALMGLAETYRSLGRRADALTYYQRYLDVLPNGAEAGIARSNIQRLQSQ